MYLVQVVLYKANMSLVKVAGLTKLALSNLPHRIQQRQTVMRVHFALEEVQPLLAAYKAQRIVHRTHISINACHVLIKSTATLVNYNQLRHHSVLQ